MEIFKNCQKCELANNPKILTFQRRKKLRIALVGQPNSGKSTFFNSLSSYKVNTANYSGTTVEYHLTTIFIKDYQVELIDLPGIYSLNYTDLAEKITFEILVNGINQAEKIDGIIQIIETASLPHALLLTLDLLTLNIPLVIALNMFDEARIKGIKVDIQTLQKILKVPVIPTISIKGENTFKTVFKLIEIIEKKVTEAKDFYQTNEQDKNIDLAETFLYKSVFYKSSFSKEELVYIVDIYKSLWKKMVDDIFESSACHLGNCRLIPACLMNIEEYAPNIKSLAKIRDDLLKLKSNIITSIASVVFSFSKPFPTFEDIFDKYILHRFWGYIVLFMILFITFYLAYFLGNTIADKIESLISGFSSYIDNISEGLGFVGPLIRGLKNGIIGGMGIVIPYLLPFLFLMAILEDSGYIPRMMYLTNSLLKPFGITARSVLGFILGLGCNVSAIMSLRGLMNNRERILASMVIPFVTCSARTVVVMALVVGYLGVWYGLFMYLLGFFVAFLSLFLINKLIKFNTPNFIVHMPPYRLPSLKSVFTKIWVRFKAFVFTAWPILILGTIIVNYLSYLHLDKYINLMLSFLTVDLLNLPIETGIPLIFGILAKEYALVMLFSALGTENVKAIMTNLQIFTFSVFVMLYTPCLSTIAVQLKEIGTKYTIYSIILNFSMALIFSFIFNKLLVFIIK